MSNQGKLAIIDLDGVVVNSGKIVDGAYDIIFNLEQNQGWAILYLTERSMSQQAATAEWLRQHDLAGPELFCKSEVDQKLIPKTAQWKSRVVQELTRRNQYERFLFIDDEYRNREAVMQLAMGNVDCYESLSQAVQNLV